MAMTAEQNKTIAGAWNDPNLSIDEKKRQMSQFGVGVTDVMNATGQDLNTVASAFKGGGDWGGLHYNTDGSLYGTDWAGPVATAAAPKPAADPMAAWNKYWGLDRPAGNTSAGQNPTVVAGPVAQVGPGLSTGPVPGINERPRPTGTSGTTGGTSGPAFNLSGIQGANQWTVDPKTQTVAGQLNTILASDSPLMQQARTRALQQQNANGRLNSTMAQSAADSAMYDAALQIAAPDASINASAAKSNTDALNTFASTGNAYQYDLGKLNQQTTAAKDVAGIEAQYKSITQGSQSATSIVNKMQDSLNQLAQNTNVTNDLPDPGQPKGATLADGRLNLGARDKMASDIKFNAQNSLRLVAAMAGDLDLSSFINSIDL